MECNMWQGKTRETPRKTCQIPFRQPGNSRVVPEMQTRGPSGEKRATNRLRHGAVLGGKNYFIK